MIVGVVLIIGIVLFAIYAFKNRANDDKSYTENRYDDWGDGQKGVFWVLSIILSIFAFCMIFVNIGTYITAISNPEYYVIQQLIGMIK
jgi:Ca2+/Na+ antiporter